MSTETSTGRVRARASGGSGKSGYIQTGWRRYLLVCGRGNANANGNGNGRADVCGSSKLGNRFGMELQVLDSRTENLRGQIEDR